MSTNPFDKPKPVAKRKKKGRRKKKNVIGMPSTSRPKPVKKEINGTAFPKTGPPPPPSTNVIKAALSLNLPAVSLDQREVKLSKSDCLPSAPIGSSDFKLSENTGLKPELIEVQCEETEVISEPIGSSDDEKNQSPRGEPSALPKSLTTPFITETSTWSTQDADQGESHLSGPPPKPPSLSGSPLEPTSNSGPPPLPSSLSGPPPLPAVLVERLSNTRLSVDSDKGGLSAKSHIEKPPRATRSKSARQLKKRGLPPAGRFSALQRSSRSGNLNIRRITSPKSFKQKSKSSRTLRKSYPLPPPAKEIGAAADVGNLPHQNTAREVYEPPKRDPLIAVNWLLSDGYLAGRQKPRLPPRTEREQKICVDLYTFAYHLASCFPEVDIELWQSDTSTWKEKLRQAKKPKTSNRAKLSSLNPPRSERPDRLQSVSSVMNAANSPMKNLPIKVEHLRKSDFMLDLQQAMRRRAEGKS